MNRKAFVVFCAIPLLQIFIDIETVHAADAVGRPNVVLIITDDQGYGDLGCHGNKEIKTPNLDRLFQQSVRLTNYHVDPTCAPSRSALMSGRYSSRTGVWHTIQGRSLMHPDELTMAEIFSAGGYKTGSFGKWHLGDNYPMRAQDQGFQTVFMHGGGGVGQTPDYWNNNYFDDTYFRNGKPTKMKGYCTDIWFDQATKFIEQNKSRPFFAYIATNAPHGPYLVAEKYSDPYKKMGIESPRAEFYGMITNIDENVGKLQTKLKQLGLDDNTVFIFTTDNGTAAGVGRKGGGFNAGMRGKKGSEYEGGHRVPFFWHWPAGHLDDGRDIRQLCAHIDILPTLSEICGLQIPATTDLDGKSLVPLLNDDNAKWPERTLAVHSQRIEFPQKWRKAAVMTDRWRLVTDGKRRELFDMKADPGQQQDVSADYPDVFKKLSKSYESWYKHISGRFGDYVRIPLGNSNENPAQLTCHDWHEPTASVPWNHGHIKRDLMSNGFWAVHVEQSGTYEITLRSRPAHVKYPLRPGTAKIQVGDDAESKPIPADATSISFRMNLKKGHAKLQTWFDEKGGKSRGAYFVDVKLLP